MSFPAYELVGLDEETKDVFRKCGAHLDKIHYLSYPENVSHQQADVRNKFNNHIGMVENLGWGWMYYPNIVVCLEDLPHDAKSPLPDLLDHIVDCHILPENRALQHNS